MKGNESRVTHYGLRITDYPGVSIIILNWNGWKDTIECLESLYQIAYTNYDAIVVDNGSDDESIEKIKGYCKGKIKVESKFFDYFGENKPIKIIEYTREEAEAGGEKEKNYGFAGGNNIGMRYALKALNPDYILLLNNDTVVDEGFLGELVKVAESDEKLGTVEPIVYHYYDPKRAQFAGGGEINFFRGLCFEKSNKKDAIKEVECLTGACFLIKREIIKMSPVIRELENQEYGAV